MSRQASGLRAWALQRLTAIYLACYVLYFILYLLFGMPENQGQWREWLTSPLISVASYVAVISLLLHSWIGVRDVIMDYIKPAFLKVVLLSLVLVYLTACGIWAARVLLLAELGI